MHKIIAFLSFFACVSIVNAQLIRVSAQGNILENEFKNHRCVLDQHSKLVWEVKLSDKGLQDTNNTYTWFDGKSGVDNGDYSHHCHWGKNCNTQAFINALNTVKLCKQSAWRLPSESELRTLLIYGDNDLLINPDFFPNTKRKSYWSADEQDVNIAIDLPFFYGGSKSSDKSFDAHIRAVSDAY
ncbi:conserved hypothetical protein [Candidatus Ruthia magnifica str. Cm (Calyptogena magnifica)]|uniref:Lcl C-terminal domain-containing protein n=1 Tax=Ruthia magnifica subsp. Calyptogena magnifica TaxID=413404 RepID=A1AWT8_RUTMC|nr:DUF1566 domain-containing protein [Candidatus Ruthturnera calyptogenae]ABL02395.1 conserved hypothetical protein [Candidatus Ruthia magnifica str. Cm (Calyptogena magnifica)]